MPLADLLQMIRRQPFQPFRLYVTDGASYEVRHPDLVMAGSRSVLIGLPPPGLTDPVYEHYVNVDLVRITRLEPIPLAASPANGQRPNRRSRWRSVVAAATLRSNEGRRMVPRTTLGDPPRCRASSSPRSSS